jgi:hypothetical protein
MNDPGQAVCPQCGEPAVNRPPTSWFAAWGPRQPYSHQDGEPLCPVVGDHGYEPARPVLPDGSPVLAASPDEEDSR